MLLAMTHHLCSEQVFKQFDEEDTVDGAASSDGSSSEELPSGDEVEFLSSDEDDDFSFSFERLVDFISLWQLQY